MMFLNFFLFIMVFSGFILSLTRFCPCLIILENVEVLLLLFSLLLGLWDSHAAFIALMSVSTVEVIVGLVVLTGLWECTNSLDSFFSFYFVVSYSFIILSWSGCVWICCCCCW